MIKDITIGQYYPAKSILHRLDPRVKFVGTIAFLISLFVADSLWGYLLATAFLAVVIVLSKVPVKFMMKGLKPLFFIFILTVAFNLFLVPGKVVVQIWILKITEEGIRQAIKIGIRLIYLVMGSSVMTLTTTPNQLTDGLEKLMRPLNKIKVPVHEIAMMMSIALRFIPILMEETDKIMKAQIARGADFESGNLIKKAKNLIPLLVPLFISAFRRADDLAYIMESYHVSMGTIMAMNELNIRIPEDVSLIGIDALPSFLTGGIDMTSIRVPHTERAYWAIQLLLKEIEHPVKEKCKLYTNCVFVDGETVKKR